VTPRNNGNVIKRNEKKRPKSRKVNCTLINNKIRETNGNDLWILRIGMNYIVGI